MDSTTMLIAGGGTMAINYHVFKRGSGFTRVDPIEYLLSQTRYINDPELERGRYYLKRMYETMKKLDLVPTDEELGGIVDNGGRW